MIGYVTLGTNDMARAAQFYDELFSVVGGKRTYETEKFIAWGNDPKTPMLFVIKPADGGTATVGNGVMIALAAKDSTQGISATRTATSSARSYRADEDTRRTPAPHR